MQEIIGFFSNSRTNDIFCHSFVLTSFVTPTSFVFGDEDAAAVRCYSQSFNYTYKVTLHSLAEVISLILLDCGFSSHQTAEETS